MRGHFDCLALPSSSRSWSKVCAITYYSSHRLSLFQKGWERLQRGHKLRLPEGTLQSYFPPASPHFQDNWSLSPLRNSSPSRLPRLIRSPVGAAVAVADKEPFGSGSAPLCLCQNSLGTLFKRNKKKSPLPPSSSGVFDSARAGWGEQGLSLCALNELP